MATCLTPNSAGKSTTKFPREAERTNFPLAGGNTERKKVLKYPIAGFHWKGKARSLTASHDCHPHYGKLSPKEEVTIRSKCKYPNKLDYEVCYIFLRDSI